MNYEQMEDMFYNVYYTDEYFYSCTRKYSSEFDSLRNIAALKDAEQQFSVFEPKTEHV